MSYEEVLEKIEKELKLKTNKNISRTIISATLSLFSNPAQSVEKLFFEKSDRDSDDKLKIEQEILLELICNISKSIDNMEENLLTRIPEKKSIIINGLIEVSSEQTDSVIGMEIKPNSGQVEFEPGTKIIVNTKNTKSSIGLKIG